MKIEKIEIMGLKLDKCFYKSAFAQVAVGNNWATIYIAASEEEGQGHMTELLRQAKKHYEGLGKTFYGSVALNNTMQHIYNKLGIKEYEE